MADSSVSTAYVLEASNVTKITTTMPMST